MARVRLGSFEFQKKGVSRFDLRDPYHLAVALSWPQFLASLLALYLAVNVVFATFFWLVPGSITQARSGNFADAFFFSLSAHDQINNLFHLRRDLVTAAEHRASRKQTFQVWAEICGLG